MCTIGWIWKPSRWRRSRITRRCWVSSRSAPRRKWSLRRRLDVARSLFHCAVGIKQEQLARALPAFDRLHADDLLGVLQRRLVVGAFMVGRGFDPAVGFQNV